MRTVFQDLRYALRFSAKNPAFAAVALLTLALGIGANTAIFSLVDAILLRPLPYPDPEQLVGLGQWRNQKGEGYTQTGVSAPNVADIANTGVFQYVGYFRWSGFNITEGTRPESVRGIKTSADLLPMFGVPPLLGRFLQPEEMEAGHDHAAVIGHSLWQTRYGSDPSILGKTIALDQRLYTIVGVMPSSFRFTWDQEMDVFVPLVLSTEERSETGRGTSRDLQTQARIKTGLTIPQAQAAMNTLADNLAREYSAANQGWGIKVEPLHDAYHREMQTPLLIMLGAVLFVLLIACANVANLLLARATARRREIAIRLSLGATRQRLITQLLTESLLLALSGGILGLLLASAGDRLLTLAMARYDFSLPNARIIDIDWRVLMFTLAITVSTGALFGLAPSWATAQTALAESLKEGGWSATTESGRRRLRNTLVVCEMALALILLSGAGLLVRTFIELVNVDLGIDPANLITTGLRLPDYKYGSSALQSAFYRDLLQKVAAIPGVTAAGASAGRGNIFFQPQGQPSAAPGQEPTASFKTVTPDFLKAGVVKDVRNDSLWRPESTIYAPFAQRPSAGVFLAIRTAVPPMSIVPGVRDTVLALDKEQPVNRIRPMSEIVAETYGALRFPMALLWIFSALALALSATGIFGVMSYTVSRRTQEMAIRMALGAGHRDVLRLVLREGLAVTLCGVALGLAGALVLSRVMAGYVYGVTSTDPLTFAAASLVLIVVALLASYLPARRAAKVDPIVALRYE